MSQRKPFYGVFQGSRHTGKPDELKMLVARHGRPLIFTDRGSAQRRASWLDSRPDFMGAYYTVMEVDLSYRTLRGTR